MVTDQTWDNIINGPLLFNVSNPFLILLIEDETVKPNVDVKPFIDVTEMLKVYIDYLSLL